MHIVRDTVTIDELKKMSEKMYNRLVKAVVDIEQEIMVIDSEMHADGEMLMLSELGSQQENLWGITIHPEFGGNYFIEFSSFINIRPSQDNRGRSVESEDIQKKIKLVVAKRISK
jgi:hypothetical protein